MIKLQKHEILKQNGILNFNKAMIWTFLQNKKYRKIGGNGLTKLKNIMKQYLKVLNILMSMVMSIGQLDNCKMYQNIKDGINFVM